MSSVRRRQGGPECKHTSRLSQMSEISQLAFAHIAWWEFVQWMLITKEEARKGIMGMENWEQQRRFDTSLCTMYNGNIADELMHLRMSNYNNKTKNKIKPHTVEKMSWIPRSAKSTT